MNGSQSSRGLSLVMSVFGFGGAIYSVFERIHAPGSNSLKYEILFVMWLVLGIGWGSRLLSNGPGESRKASGREGGSTPKKLDSDR